MEFTLIVSTLQKSKTCTFPFDIRVSNAKYTRKLLENNEIVSKTEQKELEMLIENEEQFIQKEKERERKRKTTRTRKATGFNIPKNISRNIPIYKNNLI